MGERVERARDAAARLDPAWSTGEIEAALRCLPARRRRRIRRAAGALGLAVASAALAIFAIGGRSGLAPSDSALVKLADGSTAIALSAGTEVVPLEVGPDEVVVELVRGAARFAVTHSQERTFRVRAGAVEVVALGTEFSVERQGPAVEVAVLTGHVRVETEGRAFELASGERRSFAESARTTPAPPGPSAPPGRTSDASSEPRRAGAAVPARAAKRWRALATRGEFDAAYRSFEPADVTDDVEDLLLAADVARLSGHPRGAVAPLRRIIEAHASDPRGPIAAFTLGRVLLDELGDPRGAAAAFATARTAAPRGPLAEDALAREVEAWSRCGEDARAAAAAGQYLERYPDGRRQKAVRRFGGLD